MTTGLRRGITSTSKLAECILGCEAMAAQAVVIAHPQRPRAVK